ncbi:MAG: phage tail protein [Flavobacterium johnsoniae]|jgi:microcystin-dependent protein|nr:MAG: phage tail protein [Flavobacterium johnsoniae]
MYEPFLGQIQTFGFNFPPRGWTFCDGQIMSIAQNTALFSLLGTTYGGNGQTTFALPDLRGRSVVHPGNGPGLTPVVWGEVGGIQNVTLTISNMPMHAHPLIDGQAHVATTILATNNNNGSNTTDGGSNGFGDSGNMPEIYRESPTGTNVVGGVKSVISGTTGIAGGSIPFGIRNPYLGIYTSIALEGIFPSRN